MRNLLEGDTLLGAGYPVRPRPLEGVSNSPSVEKNLVFPFDSTRTGGSCMFDSLCLWFGDASAVTFWTSKFRGRLAVRCPIFERLVNLPEPLRGKYSDNAIWQPHSCLIGTSVWLSGCGTQQYRWLGYTGLTRSQLWPMAFMSVTGTCWFTVARYPLLCVNVIAALRVIWHLSTACASGFSILIGATMVCNSKVALRSFQSARCSPIFIGGIYVRHQRNWK